DSGWSRRLRRRRPLAGRPDTRSPEAVTTWSPPSAIWKNQAGPGAVEGTEGPRHPARRTESTRSWNAVTITAENPTQTVDTRVLSYSTLPTPTDILRSEEHTSE